MLVGTSAQAIRKGGFFLHYRVFNFFSICVDTIKKMSFSALGYEKRHQCLRGMVRHSQEGTIILLGNDMKKPTKKQYTSFK
tara:strand:+ start:59 stop:301 length:243 start_codon:yes stop_codon:yes gene_type:complete